MTGANKLIILLQFDCQINAIMSVMSVTSVYIVPLCHTVSVGDRGGTSRQRSSLCHRRLCHGTQGQ